ncbi:IPT/TIG domain protein [Ancylostoma duodenale]|uniref:IPT/TIG domain protein n=1 Tax=Ancylostoma duodenale TaxID=51022 RepID=A0A0C2H3W3_9BILA|nr:IPT/TIG domain protein [Ancylostoma duodenale]
MKKAQGFQDTVKCAPMRLSYLDALPNVTVPLEFVQGEDFSPTSGPTEGGTEITIYGRDLGSAIEDVKDRVFVAGSRCSVISYEISKKIVCRVEKVCLQLLDCFYVTNFIYAFIFREVLLVRYG